MKRRPIRSSNLTSPDQQTVRDAIRTALRDIEINTANGLQSHQALAGVPTTDDVQDGQIVVGVGTGTAFSLYTSIGGAIYEAALTPLP